MRRRGIITLVELIIACLISAIFAILVGFAVAMSDNFWLYFFQFAQAVMLAIIGAVVVWRQKKVQDAVTSSGDAAKKASDNAAGKAEEVKTALEKSAAERKEHDEAQAEKMNRSIEIGEANHLLLNSGLLEKLKTVAEALRSLATALPTQINIDAADKAERDVENQQARQHKVDQLEKKS